jgi:hypothetical protein
LQRVFGEKLERPPTQKGARGYHRAAMRHLIQRDFLFFALVAAVYGIVLYIALSS